MNLDLNKINGSYLHVNISGEYTREDVIDLPLEIKNYCNELKCDSVLIDSKNINSQMVSILDQLLVGEAVASALGPTVSLAVLANDELFTHFMETVAHNRGANIKISDDLDELLLWLKKE